MLATPGWNALSSFSVPLHHVGMDFKVSWSTLPNSSRRAGRRRRFFPSLTLLECLLHTGDGKAMARSPASAFCQSYELRACNEELWKQAFTNASAQCRIKTMHRSFLRSVIRFASALFLVAAELFRSLPAFVFSFAGRQPCSNSVHRVRSIRSTESQEERALRAGSDGSFRAVFDDDAKRVRRRSMHLSNFL
ncbi:hypothetical protein BKA81DRAFT_205786 [Phyllosticta paracitricarpa]